MYAVAGVSPSAACPVNQELAMSEIWQGGEERRSGKPWGTVQVLGHSSWTEIHRCLWGRVSWALCFFASEGRTVGPNLEMALAGAVSRLHEVFQRGGALVEYSQMWWHLGSTELDGLFGLG